MDEIFCVLYEMNQTNTTLSETGELFVNCQVDWSLEQLVWVTAWSDTRPAISVMIDIISSSCPHQLSWTQLTLSVETSGAIRIKSFNNINWVLYGLFIQMNRPIYIGNWKTLLIENSTCKKIINTVSKNVQIENVNEWLLNE